MKTNFTIILIFLITVLFPIQAFSQICVTVKYRVSILNYKLYFTKAGGDNINLMVTGTVKNNSPKSVQKVKISTTCSGCLLTKTTDKWMDASLFRKEKGVVIPHLNEGQEKTFTFKAAVMNSSYWASKKSDKNGIIRDFPNGPEGLVIKVVSFVRGE